MTDVPPIPPSDVPPPTPPPSGGITRADALQKVKGPALGLIVTAGIGALYQVFSLLATLFGWGMSMADFGGGNEMAWMNSFGFIGPIIGLGGAAVVFLGANKMKNLDNWMFSLIASIVAMVPCISPCCLIGLPIGIWALVMIINADVKAQFSS